MKTFSKIKTTLDKDKPKNEDSIKTKKNLKDLKDLKNEDNL